MNESRLKIYWNYFMSSNQNRSCSNEKSQNIKNHCALICILKCVYREHAHDYDNCGNARILQRRTHRHHKRKNEKEMQANRKITILPKQSYRQRKYIDKRPIASNPNHIMRHKCCIDGYCFGVCDLVAIGKHICSALWNTYAARLEE